MRESLPDEDDLKGFLLGEPTETAVIAHRRDEAAEARVTRTLTGEFSRPYIAHASMAPSCALACVDGRTITVWTNSQGIFALRGGIAAGLGVDPRDIIVRYAEGVGVYGHNGADDAGLDAVLLARAPGCRGRPVRVMWSREDELAWSPFGSAMLARLSAGLGPDGRIQSWRQDVWSGGFLGRPGIGGEPRLLALSHLAGGEPLPPAFDGPPVPVIGSVRNSVPGYDIPDLEVTRHLLRTMPIRTSSLRSLGAFLNVFAIESMMDELAAAAGADPVAFRLAHLSDPRGRRVIEQAAALAGWPGRPASEDTGFGIGYARYKGTSGYCAAVAEVQAGTGIRVRNLWLAVDVGRVINPDGVLNQVEGGAVQSASWTLRERVRFDRTRITSVTWDSYPILRFTEVPGWPSASSRPRASRRSARARWRRARWPARSATRWPPRSACGCGTCRSPATRSSRRSRRADPRPSAEAGSGRPAADQPDGRGDEQHRQREQPAALDPLEWPEPAGRLVARPLRVAVLGEALRESTTWVCRGPSSAEGRPVEEVVGQPAKANLPPLVHHWLMIHAEPGTFGLLVTSGVR